MDIYKKNQFQWKQKEEIQKMIKEQQAKQKEEQKTVQFVQNECDSSRQMAVLTQKLKLMIYLKSRNAEHKNKELLQLEIQKIGDLKDLVVQAAGDQLEAGLKQTI